MPFVEKDGKMVWSVPTQQMVLSQEIWIVYHLDYIDKGCPLQSTPLARHQAGAINLIPLFNDKFEASEEIVLEALTMALKALKTGTRQ
jgi:hypothetical protein